VFASSGVDAPAKEITDAAGLGVGTLYRHFPRRADLIMAVLEHEIDACAEAASVLRNPGAAHDALRQWVLRYIDLVGTKRGLAEALHSGDPTFAGLHDDVAERLQPVVTDLLADVRAAGETAVELDAGELLVALSLLCQPVPTAGFDDDYNRRMAMVFIGGLR
jgi:AcrR family transcriptional regulator